MHWRSCSWWVQGILEDEAQESDPQMKVQLLSGHFELTNYPPWVLVSLAEM